ncbi:glutathione S-transferase 1-like [Leguminivora glycinivorella]|uniref:glutathione S-transferase 1-like n=1 Tax=Leguminivora glycinivorella TaxID=1035111 RepID=UPI00200E59BF|nr:glutathione S-transferase 1-like [Leguminivora glycinivorella]
MVVTLYKLDASPPVRAVKMVIAAINLPDVEYVDVNLLERDQFNENYMKLNPQHTIPTLVDDDFVIWDSHAICTYLINMYAENDSLYPSEPKKRGLIDQRLHFDSGVLFPPVREAVGPVIFGNEKSFKAEVLQKIQTGYEFTDKFLTGEWLAGDELTVADVCCVATISTANEILPIDEDLFPKLAKWMKRCSELEIYKNENEPGLKMFSQILKSKLA